MNHEYRRVAAGRSGVRVLAAAALPAAGQLAAGKRVPSLGARGAVVWPSDYQHILEGMVRSMR